MDGAYHAAEEEGEEQGGEAGSLALAVHAHRALQLATTATARERVLIQPASAAEFLLLKRSYQGAPSPMVGSAAKPVAPAVAGLSGRAAGYKSEIAAKADPEDA